MQVLKHLFNSAIYIFIANVSINGNMQFTLQTIEDLLILSISTIVMLLAFRV